MRVWDACNFDNLLMSGVMCSTLESCECSCSYGATCIWMMADGAAMLQSWYAPPLPITYFKHYSASDVFCCSVGFDCVPVSIATSQLHHDVAASPLAAM